MLAKALVKHMGEMTYWCGKKMFRLCGYRPSLEGSCEANQTETGVRGRVGVRPARHVPSSRCKQSRCKGPVGFQSKSLINGPSCPLSPCNFSVALFSLLELCTCTCTTSRSSPLPFQIFQGTIFRSPSFLSRSFKPAG